MKTNKEKETSKGKKKEVSVKSDRLLELRRDVKKYLSAFKMIDEAYLKSGIDLIKVSEFEEGSLDSFLHYTLSLLRETPNFLEKIDKSKDKEELEILNEGLRQALLIIYLTLGEKIKEDPEKFISTLNEEEINLIKTKFREEIKLGKSGRDITKLIKDIEKSPKGNSTQIYKDLIETQFGGGNDIFLTYNNEKGKEKILEKQKEGKLLNGTTEGLSGGSAYLKVFTLALAIILNEQSQYFQTKENLSGVPKDKIKEYIGEEIDFREDITLKEEIRSYPVVLVNYEYFSKKIKGIQDDSKRVGGKDIVEMRDYIDSLSKKQYLIHQGNTIVGIPFISKKASIYSPKTAKEVGCILELSPQFSKTCKGFTAIRSDTISLLGGGKQKDITMDLLSNLFFHYDKRTESYKVRKESLLERYREVPQYKSRPKRLETHFKEAVQKCKDVKLISRYKEKKNSGGEIISIFTFNKDYMEGTEVTPLTTFEEVK